MLEPRVATQNPRLRVYTAFNVTNITIRTTYQVPKFVFEQKRGEGVLRKMGLLIDLRDCRVAGS